MKQTLESNFDVLDLIKDKFNHVLIIEDDSCYSDLIKLYSNNFSKKITVFDCVEKAEKLLNIDNNVDLIITDYFIKDRKFGSSITDSAKGIPTILMSGDMENIRTENDFNLDKVSYFLDKPVDPKDLYEAINYL